MAWISASVRRWPPSHSSLPRWTGVSPRKRRRATRFPKDTALECLQHAYKRAKGELGRRFQRGQSHDEEIEGCDAPHGIVERDEDVHLHGAHIAARKRVKRQIGKHYVSKKANESTLAARTWAVGEFGGQTQRGGAQTLQMGRRKSGGLGERVDEGELEMGVMERRDGE